MHDWLVEVRDYLQSQAIWNGWQLREIRYDMSCSLPINDIASEVNSAIGPMVLLQPVQERVRVELRDRLSGRVTVIVGSAEDPVDIVNLLEEARQSHLDGHPMIPRKLVIALLLIAKLERNQMWGGKNKGYMWASDLGKGRGVDERFCDQLPAVINDLYSGGLLIKKISNGKSKYALNPDCRPLIHRALKERRFEEHLQTILIRDERVESSRSLDD